MNEEKELPQGWIWTTVNQIGKSVTGNTPSTSNPEFYGGDIPFFKPGDLGSGYSISEAETYITEAGAQSARILPPYSTLVTCIGATIGKTGFSTVAGATNQQINALIPETAVVVPQFAYFGFISPILFRQILDNASSTTLPILNKSKFEALNFPLPPLPEQRRIVAKLEELFSKLDAGVAAVRRTQALLKRYRQSVLHAAVTGELTRAWREAHPTAPAETGAALLQRIRAERRAQWEAAQVAKRGGQLPLGEGWKAKYAEPEAVDMEGLPELPEGWGWASVEQLGVIGEQPVLTGPFGTSLGTSDFVKEGVPVLTIGCLTEGGIKLNKSVHITEDKAAGLERYRLKKGDLLFSRMASVGRAGFVTDSLDGILFNYHIMRLRLDAQTVTPFFFLYYVRGAREVANYLLHVNHGATRDGINTEQLLNMPVCLPPYKEQVEIISEVERRLTVLDALSQTLTDELKRAERLRQSILHQAFTGRLVPQDATDEPAAALLARLRETASQPKTRKTKETPAAPAKEKKPRGRKPADATQIDFSFTGE